jgi:hypothetical protein
MYYLFLVENLDNSIPFLIFIDNLMLKIVKLFVNTQNPLEVVLFFEDID